MLYTIKDFLHEYEAQDEQYCCLINSIIYGTCLCRQYRNFLTVFLCQLVKVTVLATFLAILSLAET